MILESPALDFKSLLSPFSVIDSAVFGSKASVFKRIELESGELQLPLPGLKEKLKIEKIKGKALRDSSGLLHLDFRGKAAHIWDGFLRISGELTPDKKGGSLQLDFENVRFEPSSKIPISDINGRLEILDSRIVVSKLSFKFRGIPIELSGDIDQAFTPKPKWNLVCNIEQGKKTIQTDLHADLEAESIVGKLNLFGIVREFSGHITTDETGFQLQGIQFDNGYHASGVFQIESGHYMLKAERERQRFAIDLSLNDLNIDLDLDMHHLKVFDNDLTTFARLKIIPLEPAWSEGDRRFQVDLVTDYFIFNFHPLQDFKASFNLSKSGLDPLMAQWGNTCHLKGAFAFGESPSLDFTILVDAFKLNELIALGAHPMPKSLEGVLEGKVHVIGSAQKPDVSGSFNIEDGKIGSFKYDHAEVAFYGEPPYFNLLDSKIVRKDNTFLIKGDVDFSLDNIFQKVKIVSLDQIVIWKGLDIASEMQKRPELEGPESYMEKATSAGHSGSGDRSGGRRKIEAEYALTNQGSLSVTAEEDEGKQRLVTVGPKLRF